MLNVQTRTFAINSRGTKFDLVVVDVKENKVRIRGKKLFASLDKEEIVAERIYTLNHTNSAAEGADLWVTIHKYLRSNLDSEYYSMEILNWLEGNLLKHIVF